MICRVTYESQLPNVMSLRESERIYVVERINQDWWFVRKTITQESGLIPADAVTDSVSFERYISKSIEQIVDNLPEPSKF